MIAAEIEKQSVAMEVLFTVKKIAPIVNTTRANILRI
jgi:hypothetical protein